MNLNQNSSAANSKNVPEATTPAVIISEENFYSYSNLLRHHFVGLADIASFPTLICSPKCEPDIILSPASQVIYHPIFKMPFSAHPNRKRLLRQLYKINPTILHCFGLEKIKLTRHIAQQLNIPYVVTISQTSKHFTPFTPSLSNSQFIIAPSKTIAENLTKKHPGCKKLIKQINFGTFVDDTCTCFFNPSQMTGMIMINPLNQLSDFEALLAAIKHLAVDGHNFILIIVGSGPAERKLRKAITALGLSQVVNIVPEITPLRSMLAGADIFIRPTPQDSFDPFTMEAMSVGLVIAAAKGTVDDLIIDSETAVNFEPDDELSIYSALQKILNKKEYARQLAQNAQQLLKTEHTVSKMVSSIMDVYRTAQRNHTNMPK